MKGLMAMFQSCLGDQWPAYCSQVRRDRRHAHARLHSLPATHPNTPNSHEGATHAPPQSMEFWLFLAVFAVVGVMTVVWLKIVYTRYDGTPIVSSLVKSRPCSQLTSGECNALGTM